MDDMNLFVQALLEIRIRLYIGVDVPQKFIKEYFELISKPELQSSEERVMMLHGKEDKILKDIDELGQGFSFSNLTDKKKHYGSTEFVKSYLSRLRLDEIYELSSDNKLFIGHCTEALYNYLKPVTDRYTNKDFPSEYKQTIIIGIILLSFGLINDKKWFDSSDRPEVNYQSYLHKKVAHHFKSALKAIRNNN